MEAAPRLPSSRPLVYGVECIWSVGLRMADSSSMVLVLAHGLAGGCGASFGPGVSSTDTALFAEPPTVVHQGQDYVLVWTQGSYPFFFQPSYKPMDGRLVFSQGATASSGNMAGRHREMKIEGAGNILALQRGGAYWAEPEP